MKKIWEERVRYFNFEDIKLIKKLNRIVDKYFDYTFLCLFGLMTVFGILYAFWKNEYVWVLFMIGAVPISFSMFIFVLFLLTGLFYIPYLDSVIKSYRKGRTLLYARIRGAIVQIGIWIIIIILLKIIGEYYHQ